MTRKTPHTVDCMGRKHGVNDASAKGSQGKSIIQLHLTPAQARHRFLRAASLVGIDETATDLSA